MYKRQLKREALLVKRLYLAFYLNQQRIAFAIQRLAGRDLNPSFADAVLIHIKTLFVVKFDADIVFKNRSDVMWATRIDGELIREGWALCSIVHGDNYQLLECAKQVFDGLDN